MPWKNTHTLHTTVLLLFWNMSGTTQVSRYQKGKTRKVKTNLDLLEQETVSGNGICWAICKSAPHPRQPRQHPTTQFFTGRMPFLPPNQQCQSTEGHTMPCFFTMPSKNWARITSVWLLTFSAMQLYEIFKNAELKEYFWFLYCLVCTRQHVRMKNNKGIVI